MNLILKICDNLEKFCAWSFDNGIFYFSGRDVYCILLGISLSVIVVLTIKLFIREEKSEEK